MTETIATELTTGTPNPSDPRLIALADVFGDDFAQTFRDPVMFLKQVLSSPAPLSFYRRDFRLLSRYLFLESVYRRRSDYNQELLDNFARMTGEKMTGVLELLTRRIDQMSGLLKSNGVTPERVYIQDQELLIPVIATHARSFIGLLVKLDEFYQLTGYASLYGLLDGAQRSRAELESRKAVRAFTAMVRNEQVKLRKESWRMRAARDAANLPVEPEVDHAENSVNKAQAEFDAAPDGQMDPAHVSLDDAAKVLDELVATGVASAGAARKRMPKASPDTPSVENAQSDSSTSVAG